MELSKVTSASQARIWPKHFTQLVESAPDKRGIANDAGRRYGLLEGQAESAVPTLAIQVGDTSSRSASQGVARLLKKTFMTNGRQVRVFTDVEITAVGSAT